MGYQTDFEGSIKITPTLPQELVDAVNAVAQPRNNVYGDGDPYSFDAVVHHLIGKPEQVKDKFGYPAYMSPFEMKERGVSKVPSCWCQWVLVNNQEGTFIEWDEGEKFYEYIQWMQYVVDFVTLYAKHMFNIDIQRFDGTITWDGEDDHDAGSIQVKPRMTPELTDFYPDDFLPLPPPPAEKARHSWNTKLRIPDAPKGAPFMSLFGVEATVTLGEPLTLALVQDVHGSIGKGGYALRLEDQPNSSTLTFYVHHEKSHRIQHQDDPQFELKAPEKDMWQENDWFHKKAVATSAHPTKVKSLKNIAADTIVKLGSNVDVPNDEEKAYVDDLTSTAECRKCTGCGGRLDGPAYQLALWCWPYGYSHYYALAIYCNPRCVYEIDD